MLLFHGSYVNLRTLTCDIGDAITIRKHIKRSYCHCTILRLGRVRVWAKAGKVVLHLLKFSGFSTTCSPVIILALLLRCESSRNKLHCMAGAPFITPCLACTAMYLGYLVPEEQSEVVFISRYIRFLAVSQIFLQTLTKIAFFYFVFHFSDVATLMVRNPLSNGSALWYG